MVKFPLADSSVPELSRVVNSWACSASVHEWNEGADEVAISAVESSLGRSLPPVLRAIYKMSDGLYLFQSCLVFEPLRPAKEGALALVDYSDNLRKWKWPIPPELVTFGGNGSDELFGVWLPTNPKPGYSNPVIMIGEIFEDRSFAVVGTDVCKFLTAESAILTMLYLPEIGKRAGKKALDALGVPANLRAMDPEAEEAELKKKLYEWADPALPDHSPDPYDRGLTAEQLRNSYGRNVT